MSNTEGLSYSANTFLAWRPDDVVKQRDPSVAEETHEERRPRLVRLETFVELRGDLPDLREARPRDSHQIVVFVVIPDVERHLVERAVVRVGLLAGREREVLLDP